MLNLIFGPSGSGKTNRLIEAIKRDIQAEVRCFLLVPEQQVYISERDLAAVLPKNAGLYFEAVSFSGLAQDVFREYGGVAQSSSGNGIHSVLMWETLRQLSPLLKQYGKNARSDTAMTTKMLSAVTEFRNNGIDSDCLERAAEQLPTDSPLRKKISDLALIYATYRELALREAGSDPSERLTRMAELLERHRYFAGCHIYVDSFTGFTVPEYSVLKQIIRQADSVTVTLCADDYLSGKIHFESVSQTARRLIRAGQSAGSEIYREILPAANSDKPAQLRILERELWDFELTKAQREIPAEEPSAIRMIVCSNLYEEAEACALNILGLVQSGMHYGDIAVTVRDTETYRGVLDAALERYGIPCFFSERTDLTSKPLSRLILSALRAISRNYRAQDILTLLKTGLSGADLRDAALFEEYCETWHINGARFMDDAWSMNPDGLTDKRSERSDEILAAANRVRKIVMLPLQELSASMRASARLSDRCRAVYEYLCKLGISAQLSGYAKEELALDQHREAGETIRLYRFITETLTGLCTLLPDTELTLDEFLSVLTLFFSATDLGSVPNVHDCVTVGSAAMMRVENIRASFLLGLCEGEFPRAVADDGILTESDKRALEDLGISLYSGQALRSSEELFYVYRAVTKPSEKLFLSYPAMQTDGSPKSPSLAFTRVKYLFDLEIEEFDLGQIRKCDLSRGSNDVHDVLSAPPLPSGTTLRLSQSTIQSFVLCPYRYYTSNLLRLRPQMDSTVSPADEGTFLHFVFEQFLSSSLGEDGKLHLPPVEKIPEVADRVIAAYLDRVCPIPPDRMDHRLLHLFEKLRGQALLMLRDIVAEISVSQFRPTRFEQVLGGKNENALPPVILTLRDGCRVELRGTVDRVDVFEQNGSFYIRIVDYKSGTHEFSLDDVRSGVDIQLVLYLFAVVSSDPEHMIPVGAQYLYAHNDKGKTKISRDGFLLDDEAIRSAADPTDGSPYLRGLLSQTADEIRALNEDMQKVVCNVAERILSGEAGKTPSERACRFCPVRDHCDLAILPKR